MGRLHLLILLCVLFVSKSGNADADSLINLEGLIQKAVANNPGLQALRADYEASEMQISWFTYVPDPVVGIEYGDIMTMYSVTQQVPFPTKIVKRREVAQNEAEYYYFQYLDKERNIIRRVKQSYAELLMLHAKITATERSIAFLEQIHNVSRQKYSINESSQAEVLMTQVQLAKSENQLILLKDDLMIAQANLNTLLNRDLEASLPLSMESVETVNTLSLDSLYTLAQENEPQLKALLSRQEAAETELAMARQTYLPDFAFKYTYEDMNNDMHNNKYMVGFTVPIWFLDKQNKFVRESAANLRGVSARYENLVNDTRLVVKQAKTRVEKYQHMVDLYRNSVLPQAEAALKSALSAYRFNTVDFQILLESERSLVENEYSYEEARANLFIAMAELEETVGITE
jgi:cobalt-zinc-cadmium efflux system outer membrane protein